MAPTEPTARGGASAPGSRPPPLPLVRPILHLRSPAPASSLEEWDQLAKNPPRELKDNQRCPRCRQLSRTCFVTLDPNPPVNAERQPRSCTKCAAEGELCGIMQYSMSTSSRVDVTHLIELGVIGDARVGEVSTFDMDIVMKYDRMVDEELNLVRRPPPQVPEELIAEGRAHRRRGAAGPPLWLFREQRCSGCRAAKRKYMFTGNSNNACEGCMASRSESTCDLSIESEGVRVEVDFIRAGGPMETAPITVTCKACDETGFRCFSVKGTVGATCTRCQVTRTQCDLRPKALPTAFETLKRFEVRIAPEKTDGLALPWWFEVPFPPEHIVTSPHECKNCTTAQLPYRYRFADLARCISCKDTNRSECEPLVPSDMPMGVGTWANGRMVDAHDARSLGECRRCEDASQPSYFLRYAGAAQCQRCFGQEVGMIPYKPWELGSNRAAPQLFDRVDCDLHREILFQLDRGSFNKASATWRQETFSPGVQAFERHMPRR